LTLGRVQKKREKKGSNSKDPGESKHPKGSKKIRILSVGKSEKKEKEVTRIQ